MRISKRSVNRYCESLHLLGGQADQYVMNMLALEESSDVAAIRESAISAIAEAIGAQGDIAQALAAQLYDTVCQAEGISTKPAEIFDSVIDHDRMVEKVHYYARDLVLGAREKFDKECADLAEFYVRRCAYENTVRNCGANNVRYARIPTGLETCTFCFMLASRGFVYHSEAKARGAHGVHQHCDCIVMPGVNGRTEIEGYNWRDMQDRWLECQATAGVRDGETFDGRHATLREVATRDPRWLFTGDVPEITFESEDLRRLKETDYRHEIETAERLRQFGVACDFAEDEIAEIDSNGKKTGRVVGYADLANGFELKTTKSASSYNTINCHLKNASKKPNAKAVVFDNTGNPNLSDEELIRMLNRSQTFKRGRMYVITHEGDYRFIR